MWFRVASQAAALTAAVAVLIWSLGAPWLGFGAIFGLAATVFWRGSTAQTAPRPAVSATPALPPGFSRMVLERVPAALLLISEKGRIDYANTAALQVLPQILIGSHYGNLIRAPSFMDAVQKSLELGDRETVEFSQPGTDSIFEAQIARLPISDAADTTRQVIVSLEDRSEAHRIMRMRSDFIANASHELRTPLTSVIGYIETLRTHGVDDPEAAEQFLAIMDRQAQRMRRLVDDLMSLSRIEMAAEDRPEDPALLYDLVQQAVSELAPAAEQAGVDITVSLTTSGKANPDKAGTNGASPDKTAADTNAPVVACDRDQIIQVFTNLLDNAIKYGATKVRVSPPEEARNGFIGISIRDNGPGIPRADLPRLTERFFRVNVSQSKSVGGTGLGLAIVKHILNRHDGTLEIQSDADQGSDFVVWLPLAPGAKE